MAESSTADNVADLVGLTRPNFTQAEVDTMVNTIRMWHSKTYSEPGGSTKAILQHIYSMPPKMRALVMKHTLEMQVNEEGMM